MECVAHADFRPVGNYLMRIASKKPG